MNVYDDNIVPEEKSPYELWVEQKKMEEYNRIYNSYYGGNKNDYRTKYQTNTKLLPYISPSSEDLYDADGNIIGQKEIQDKYGIKKAQREGQNLVINKQNEEILRKLRPENYPRYRPTPQIRPYVTDPFAAANNTFQTAIDPEAQFKWIDQSRNKILQDELSNPTDEDVRSQNPLMNAITTIGDAIGVTRGDPMAIRRISTRMSDVLGIGNTPESPTLPLMRAQNNAIVNDPRLGNPQETDYQQPKPAIDPKVEQMAKQAIYRTDPIYEDNYKKIEKEQLERDRSAYDIAQLQPEERGVDASVYLAHYIQQNIQQGKTDRVMKMLSSMPENFKFLNPQQKLQQIQELGMYQSLKQKVNDEYANAYAENVKSPSISAYRNLMEQQVNGNTIEYLTKEAQRKMQGGNTPVGWLNQLNTLSQNNTSNPIANVQTAAIGALQGFAEPLQKAFTTIYSGGEKIYKGDFGGGLLGIGSGIVQGVIGIGMRKFNLGVGALSNNGTSIDAFGQAVEEGIGHIFNLPSEIIVPGLRKLGMTDPEDLENAALVITALGFLGGHSIYKKVKGKYDKAIKTENPEAEYDASILVNPKDVFQGAAQLRLSGRVEPRALLEEPTKASKSADRVAYNQTMEQAGRELKNLKFVHEAIQVNENQVKNLKDKLVNVTDDLQRKEIIQEIIGLNKETSKLYDQKNKTMETLTTAQDMLREQEKYVAKKNIERDKETKGQEGENQFTIKPTEGVKVGEGQELKYVEPEIGANLPVRIDEALPPASRRGIARGNGTHWNTTIEGIPKEYADIPEIKELPGRRQLSGQEPQRLLPKNQGLAEGESLADIPEADVISSSLLKNEKPIDITKVPNAKDVPNLRGQTVWENPTELKIKEGMQFKHNADESGVTKGERINTPFDEQQSNVVKAWIDPSTGEKIIVDGHHRLSAAMRDNAPKILTRYIDADTFEQARTQGAVANMIDNRGTSVDAARFLKSSDFTPDEIGSKFDIRKGSIIDNGIKLSKLNDQLLDKVEKSELYDKEKKVGLNEELLPTQYGSMIGETFPIEKGMSKNRIDEQTMKQNWAYKQALANSDLTIPELKTALKNADLEMNQSSEGLFGESSLVDINKSKAAIDTFISNKLSNDITSANRAIKTSKFVDENAVGNIDTKATKDLRSQIATREELFNNGLKYGDFKDVLSPFYKEYDNATTNSQRTDIKSRAAGAVESYLNAATEKSNAPRLGFGGVESVPEGRGTNKINESERGLGAGVSGSINKPSGAGSSSPVEQIAAIDSKIAANKNMIANKRKSYSKNPIADNKEIVRLAKENTEHQTKIQEVKDKAFDEAKDITDLNVIANHDIHSGTLLSDPFGLGALYKGAKAVKKGLENKPPKDPNEAKVFNAYNDMLKKQKDKPLQSVWKNSTPDETPILSKLKNNLVDFRNYAFRLDKNLDPNNAQDMGAKISLDLLKHYKGESYLKAMNYLKYSVKKLDPTGYNLINEYYQWRDLKKSITENLYAPENIKEKSKQLKDNGKEIEADALLKDYTLSKNILKEFEGQTKGQILSALDERIKMTDDIINAPYAKKIRDALNNIKKVRRFIIEEAVREGAANPKWLTEYNIDNYKHRIVNEHVLDKSRSAAWGKLTSNKSHEMTREGTGGYWNKDFVESEGEFLNHIIQKTTEKKIARELGARFNYAADFKDRLNNVNKNRIARGENSITMNEYLNEYNKKNGTDYKQYAIDDNHIFNKKTTFDAEIEKLLTDAGFNIDEVKSNLKGSNEQWIIKDHLAKAIDDLRSKTNSRTLLEDIIGAPGRVWKKWVLHSPPATATYNINNLSSDFDRVVPVIADNLWETMKNVATGKKFSSGKLYEDLKWATKNAKDLFSGDIINDNWFKNTKDVKLIKEAIDNGVVSSTQTAVESGKIASKSMFMDQRGKTAGGYKEVVTDFLPKVAEFRENSMRLALYKHLFEKLEKGENVNSYASNPTMISKMPDNYKKAARLAEDILGNYWDRSQFIQDATKITPFIRWTATNFQYYNRMFTNTLKTPEGKITPLSFAKSVGIVAPRLTGTVLKTVALTAAVQMYNKYVWGDTEAMLSDEQRRQNHIIISKDGDKLNTMKVTGSLSDYADWPGLLNFQRDWKEGFLKNINKVGNSRTVEEVGKNVLNSLLTLPPVAKTLSMLDPTFKVPAEMVMGKTIYPRADDPRAIRDPFEYLARTWRLGDVYNWVAGKPVKNGDHLSAILRGLSTYTTDIGESAYFKTQQYRNEFLRSKGVNPANVEPTEDQNITYNLKRAIKYGDTEAINKYKSIWLETKNKKLEGLSGKELEKEKNKIMNDFYLSIAQSSPFSGITDRYYNEYMDFLSKKPMGNEVAKMATDWYANTYGLYDDINIAKPKRKKFNETQKKNVTKIFEE